MSGSITPNPTFNEVPEPLYRPGSYVEVRPGYQNVGLLPYPARNLIIGQMTSAGTAVAGAINQNITQPAQATLLGGVGSILETQVLAYLKSGCPIPLDVIAVADATGSTAATQTVTIGGTWTAGGTVPIQVAGTRVAIGALGSDTPLTVGPAWAAAVNAIPQLPVTAAAGSGSSANVVTLTAKNKGLTGSDINLVVCPATGDVLPTGMTVTLAAGTAGAVAPSIAGAISAIYGLWYTGIAMPWQDTTNVQLLGTELVRRFNAMVREDARAYLCITGSYSATVSAIANINYRDTAVLPMTKPGSTPWAVGASMLGVCEAALLKDPSLQLGELALPGIVGPQRVNLLDDTEAELMLAAKGSTYTMLRDGTVILSRVLSSYTANAQGVADSLAYFDFNEVAVASRIRYDWRQFRKVRFPTNKLAPDGSTAAEYNSNIATPSRMKAAYSSRMMVWAKTGWIENETADARASYFLIDPNDRNRMNYHVQYTRIGNLIVDAGVLEFQVL